jgi:hypothetical protein
MDNFTAVGIAEGGVMSAYPVTDALRALQLIVMSADSNTGEVPLSHIDEGRAALRRLGYPTTIKEAREQYEAQCAREENSHAR